MTAAQTQPKPAVQTLPAQMGSSAIITLVHAGFCVQDPSTNTQCHGKLTIRYKPNGFIAPAEAVHPYLASFASGKPCTREECVAVIARELGSALRPHGIEVSAEFSAGNGITINPLIRSEGPWV